MGASPYQERIGELRAQLRVMQRQLVELEAEGFLRDRLLQRMRPLYDDLFALHSEFELGEARKV